MPIGDKIELNLGPDPEVIFDLVKLRTWRDDIWMQINGANIFRRVDQPGMKIDINSSWPAGTTTRSSAQRVRNYTKKPIDLEVRRAFRGHVIFRSELEAKNHDFQTVEYTAAVKPGEKAELLYEIMQHQGHNAKQNNVTIEKAGDQVIVDNLLHGECNDKDDLISATLVAACVTFGAVARAENVDLSTVPARNTVQLTIYNSEDLTLVRETRKVSFKPGANPLKFSWANTLIDPDVRRICGSSRTAKS